MNYKTIATIAVVTSVFLTACGAALKIHPTLCKEGEVPYSILEGGILPAAITLDAIGPRNPDFVDIGPITIVEVPPMHKISIDANSPLIEGRAIDVNLFKMKGGYSIIYNGDVSSIGDYSTANYTTPITFRSNTPGETFTPTELIDGVVDKTIAACLPELPTR
jgi:hypothetical protein